MTGRVGNDLTGRRFGRLVAEEKGYIVWRCRCDCGNEIFVSSRRLLRGAARDCGCVAKKDGRRGREAEDLTGRGFGQLTVVRRAENRNGRTCWLCRCSCGGEKEVTAHDLKSGMVKSCGCLIHQREYRWVDITGRRFGRLTALEPTERRDIRGNIYWRCRCDCGKETLATESNLVNGTRKSCGCLRKENQEKIGERLHRVDGSCIEFLEKRKYRKDNKSGFRGVYQLPNGRYRVDIGFRRKRIYLGTYADYEQAVGVRLDAEEKIYGNFIDSYREWEKKAERDPEWAEKNPFRAEWAGMETERK